MWHKQTATTATNASEYSGLLKKIGREKKLRDVVIRLSYANPEWKQSGDGEADM